MPQPRQSEALGQAEVRSEVRPVAPILRSEDRDAWTAMRIRRENMAHMGVRGGTRIWWTVEKIEFKRREAPKEDRAEPQAA